MESAVSGEESTSSIQNQEPGETNKTQKNRKRQHQQPLHLTNEQQDILTWFQVIFIVGTVYLVLLMKSFVLHLVIFLTAGRYSCYFCFVRLPS